MEHHLSRESYNLQFPSQLGYNEGHPPHPGPTAPPFAGADSAQSASALASASEAKELKARLARVEALLAFHVRNEDVVPPQTQGNHRPAMAEIQGKIPGQQLSQPTSYDPRQPSASQQPPQGVRYPADGNFGAAGKEDFAVRIERPPSRVNRVCLTTVLISCAIIINYVSRSRIGDSSRDTVSPNYDSDPYGGFGSRNYYSGVYGGIGSPNYSPYRNSNVNEIHCNDDTQLEFLLWVAVLCLVFSFILLVHEVVTLVKIKESLATSERIRYVVIFVYFALSHLLFGSACLAIGIVYKVPLSDVESFYTQVRVSAIFAIFGWLAFVISFALFVFRRNRAEEEPGKGRVDDKT